MQLVAVAVAFVGKRTRPRCKKALLAAVMGWSLIVAPAAVLLGGRGGAWGLVSVLPAFGSLPAAIWVAYTWDYGSGAVVRERLTSAPVFTAAVLLGAGPFLVPWAAHETVGQPVLARVMEAKPTAEEGVDENSGQVSYRLADAATEQDLGWTSYGPRKRTPVGTVVEVSVVPGGWARPASTERLDDGGAEPYVIVLAAMATVHVLACAGVWSGWPRQTW
ncbi:hypothetical protein [Streptomyces sp. NPDC050535]|uniref:hypothetical protein n=1 Tax=Streptomyces sp. NPDC050535 TaxID=3365626 RepID=UPI0037903A64